MNPSLIDIPENTAVMITTFQGSSFEATYRGFIPVAERYEFGIRIAPGHETTVLLHRSKVKSFKANKIPVE